MGVHRKEGNSRKLLVLSSLLDAPDAVAHPLDFTAPYAPSTTIEKYFNPALQKFLVEAPPHKISSGRPSTLDVGLDLSFFVRDSTFVRYPGSMTSPPCAEWVIWLVRRDVPLSAAVSQIQNL